MHNNIALNLAVPPEKIQYIRAYWYGIIYFDVDTFELR